MTMPSSALGTGRLRAPELEPFEPEPTPSHSEFLRTALHVRPWWRKIVDSAPVTHTNRDTLAAELSRTKRIVICADGTWNTPSGVKPGGDAPTNVWLFYQLVKDHDATGTPQLKFYHAGVGTQSWLPRRILDGATGRGLSDNMRDAYRFLVDNYNPGDHVYLFGFSRGAYTVRTLAGMIRNSGVIDRRKHARPDQLRKATEKAYDLYSRRTPDSKPGSPQAVSFRADNSHPDFYLACIGVWDTVGSLGIPVESKLTSPLRWFNEDRVGFHDVTLSRYVDCAFHALAADERRGPFKPTLWQQQAEGRDAGQIVEQVWFSGVHSDVGGGYPWHERGLANVALRWMLKRVTSTSRIDLDLYPMHAIEQKAPSMVALHDSMEWYYKALGATRISPPFDRELDADDATEELHRSVDRCRGTYAHGFPLTGRPYAPQNIARFVERRGGAERRVATTGSVGAERRSGEDRRDRRG
jgi:uncharacterized protein (DUF2235 family)